MSQRICVLLAGGHGRRLWPLSREEFPKQFLSLDGKETLFSMTLARASVGAGEKGRLAVISSERDCAALKYEYGEKIDHYISEPSARNTGIAILHMLNRLQGYYGEDDLVVIMPADHVISDHGLWKDALDKAAERAALFKEIVLLGISPVKASSEYGYIVPSSGDEVTSVMQFVEKPSEDEAQRLIVESHALWNSGIFVGRLGVLIDLVSDYAAPLYEQVKSFCRGEISYEELPAIQFDKMILEKNAPCAVIRSKFSWYDIGSHESFIACVDSRQTKGGAYTFQGRGNLAFAAKPVVFAGVDDLCLIEMDDLILVKRAGSQEVVVKAQEYFKEKLAEERDG